MAENTVLISFGKVEFSFFQSVAKPVLIEAYSKMGKTVEFIREPGERSLVDVNTGYADAELARVDGLETKYLNFIKVPIPIAYDEVTAYTKQEKFKVEGWHSLKPYAIEHMLGFKKAEYNTKGMDTEKVTTEKQGLNKVNAGRSDVFIGFRGTACNIKKLKLPEVIALQPPIEKVLMYHYLNNRHHKMAAELAVVLRQMKESGELELIQNKAKQDFIDHCI